MSGSPQSANSTVQLAQPLPGFDPTSVISAGEQQLADYLARPTQQILDEFGMQRSDSRASAPPSQAVPANPTNPGGPTSPINPAQLISPVLNALGSLGSGQFPGMDPRSNLSGISNALGSSAGPVSQTLAALEQGWLGASSTSAGAKTATALARGTDLAKQANVLRSNLTTAAADVAQARSQLIEIVQEFMATLAAIGPSIIFPWGWAAVLEAAAKAVAHTTTVMTELQSSLAALASALAANGAPINIPATSLLGTSTAGAATAGATSPLSAMGMLSPLMSVATAGISPALSAASMAGRPAASAATGAATLAGATDADPKSHDAGGAGKSGGAVAPASGAGGGGKGAAGGALVSRATAPMPPAAPQTATTATPAISTRPATGAAAVGGAGMMGGAPLAGAGQGTGAGGAHTAASFLHTSDQGGKVVKDGTTVAPPVIGEADPNQTPDIELRI